MTDSFENYGIEIPNWKTSGKDVKVKCPQCSETRKNKLDKSLSVNVDEGIWKCHYCEWSGGLKKNSAFQKEERVKTYKLPKALTEPLTDSGLEYMASRGISKNTIQRLNITGREGVVNFNYYLNSVLTYMKCRTYPDKDFFTPESGCRPIPYNADAIKEASGKQLYIYEGEMDAATHYEVMLQTNFISVPNGATSFGWLDDFYADLNTVKSFVICTDGDQKGLEAREEIARRLGKYRCKYIDYPVNESTGEVLKDINSVAMELGSDVAKKVICSPVDFPIDGIISKYDIVEAIINIELNGFPTGDKIGMSALDPLYTVKPGELTIITGTPGSGKSEIVDEMMMSLCKSSAGITSMYTQYDWRCAYVSLEKQPTAITHVPGLITRYHRKPFMMCTSNEKAEAVDFIMSRYFFLQLAIPNLSMQLIFDKLKELVFRHGVNAVVLDPYNRLPHNRKGSTEHDYVQIFLSEVIGFLQAFQVKVFLVAHPTKMQKKTDGSGNFEVPSLYNISGSSHFYNMTDNGISMWRDFNSKIVEMHVQKIRFEWIGQMGVAVFNYNKPIKKYTSIETLYSGTSSDYSDCTVVEEAKSTQITYEERLRLSKDNPVEEQSKFSFD